MGSLLTFLTRLSIEAFYFGMRLTYQICRLSQKRRAHFSPRPEVDRAAASYSHQKNFFFE